MFGEDNEPQPASVWEGFAVLLLALIAAGLGAMAKGWFG